MFGRSSNQVALSLPGNEEGGRSAAISILPGMPLPHDLIPTTFPTGGQDAPAADFTAADRELVSVGAHQMSASDGATAGAPAFGVGTLTPPPPTQDFAPAKAKRASFSGLRRRKSAEVAPEHEPFGAPDPIEPATGFFAPTAPPTAPPAAPPAPDAFPPPPVGEAHIVTEVHVVAEAPEPFDIAAELAAESAAQEAAEAVTHAVPSGPAPLAPEPFVHEELVAAPSAPAPLASPAGITPPPFVPTAEVPAAAPAAAIVDEDPLFLHVPVLTGTGTPAPVAPVASPEAPLSAARVSFVDRLRGRRPEAPAAPLAAPVVPVPAAPTAGSPVPPPFTPPAPGAPVPPAFAPTQAELPPAYVPLGSPAPAPVGPPVEATGTAVPAFAHLVPTQPAGFPADLDAMASQVAAQVATDHAEQAQQAAPAPYVPVAEAPAAPTVGLVFADGTHADLADGPTGAALAHVANALTGDDTAAGTPETNA